MSRRLAIRLALAIVAAALLARFGPAWLGMGAVAPVKLPLRLDMSHPRFNESPPGYTSVLPSDTYTARRGFGWSQGVGAFDANTWPDDRLNLDSLHRDSHMGLNAEGDPGPSFLIDLPSGRYRLTVVTGASVHGVHALGLRINGKKALAVEEIIPDGAPRVFALEVVPVDGRIEIEPFTEYGTEWLISALELDRLRDSD